MKIILNHANCPLTHHQHVYMRDPDNLKLTTDHDYTLFFIPWDVCASSRRLLTACLKPDAALLSPIAYFCGPDAKAWQEKKAGVIIPVHVGVGEAVAHCAAFMRCWSQQHFTQNESGLERHLGRSERGTCLPCTPSSTLSSFPVEKIEGIILAVPQRSWSQKKQTLVVKIENTV